MNNLRCNTKDLERSNGKIHFSAAFENTVEISIVNAEDEDGNRRQSQWIEVNIVALIQALQALALQNAQEFLKYEEAQDRAKKL